MNTKLEIRLAIYTAGIAVINAIKKDNKYIAYRALDTAEDMVLLPPLPDVPEEEQSVLRKSQSLIEWWINNGEGYLPGRPIEERIDELQKLTSVLYTPELQAYKKQEQEEKITAAYDSDADHCARETARVCKARTEGKGRIKKISPISGIGLG